MGELGLFVGVLRLGSWGGVGEGGGKRQIGVVVGVGVGLELASWARKRWEVFEIDPAVEHVKQSKQL